jgi:hypothetical protein
MNDDDLTPKDLEILADSMTVEEYQERLAKLRAFKASVVDDMG